MRGVMNDHRGDSKSEKPATPVCHSCRKVSNGCSVWYALIFQIQHDRQLIPRLCICRVFICSLLKHLLRLHAVGC